MKQIVPRRRLIAASIAVAALAAGLARAQATTSKVAAVVDFEADLGHASATAHAPFKAGGASWSCSTTHCTGKGPGNNPAATCASLVVQVGTLKTFTAAGKSVDVKACNGTPPAMSAAPMRPATVAAMPVAASTVAKPAPPAASKNAKPAPPAAPPAPAAPAKKSAAGAAAASGSGITFTAAPMTIRGTGALPTFAPFTPLAWTAAPMSISATGAAPVSHPPAGIAFTTDTMRLSGAP